VTTVEAAAEAGVEEAEAGEAALAADLGVAVEGAAAKGRAGPRLAVTLEGDVAGRPEDRAVDDAAGVDVSSGSGSWSASPSALATAGPASCPAVATAALATAWSWACGMAGATATDVVAALSAAVGGAV
jgi:hypothetical protein